MAFLFRAAPKPAMAQAKIRATLKERENLGQAPDNFFGMESPFAASCKIRHKICGEEISEHYSSEGPSGIWFFDDEMCFAATCHDDAAAKNFGDHLRGIP